MADDPITRHFFNGFIRLHILYHAAKEPIYGAEITEELVRHGYRISQGTLYPTLHLLETLGYLRRRNAARRRPRPQILPGHRRRPHASWSRRSEKLRELVAEVLEDHDRPFQTSGRSAARRAVSAHRTERRNRRPLTPARHGHEP